MISAITFHLTEWPCACVGNTLRAELTDGLFTVRCSSCAAAAAVPGEKLPVYFTVLRASAPSQNTPDNVIPFPKR